MSYIYKITNIENEKFYVGKSIKLHRRWWEHLYIANTKNNRHPLYDSIRKYGPDKFKVDIIEECTDSILNEREIYWIAKLTPPYNITIGGDGGDTFSKRTDASKEITRKKLSEHAKKCWNDPTYKSKQVESQKKCWNDPTYKSKQVESQKKCWNDPTYKSKQVESMKERWNDPTYKSKQVESMKERWNDPSYRERMTLIANQNAKNPVYLKKVSEGVKKAIESKKDIWSECKRGNKNGRWLGYVEMYTPDGKLYKRYETAVDCHHDTGLSKHLIRRKAEAGKCMERGCFKNYTFKLVK